MDRDTFTTLSERARSAVGMSRAMAGKPAASPVLSMPGWVSRFVVLEREEGGCRVWCEPVRSADPLAPSQFVLDLPPGRYLVDTYDEQGMCCARESALGGPLVAGLTFTGGPVLVHVRSM